MKPLYKPELERLVGKIKADLSSKQERIADLEEQVLWLTYRVFDDLTNNPFMMAFSDLDGLTVTGIWNEAKTRIEC